MSLLKVLLRENFLQHSKIEIVVKSGRFIFQLIPYFR